MFKFERKRKINAYFELEFLGVELCTNRFEKFVCHSM